MQAMGLTPEGEGSAMAFLRRGYKVRRRGAGEAGARRAWVGFGAVRPRPCGAATRRAAWQGGGGSSACLSWAAGAHAVSQGHEGGPVVACLFGSGSQWHSHSAPADLHAVAGLIYKCVFHRLTGPPAPCCPPLPPADLHMVGGRRGQGAVLRLALVGGPPPSPAPAAAAAPAAWAAPGAHRRQGGMLAATGEGVPCSRPTAVGSTLGVIPPCGLPCSRVRPPPSRFVSLSRSDCATRLSLSLPFWPFRLAPSLHFILVFRRNECSSRTVKQASEGHESRQRQRGKAGNGGAGRSSGGKGRRRIGVARGRVAVAA